MNLFILLQQINTLQTLRYLTSCGSENNQGQNIISNITIDPKLKMLLSGWCIDNHNLSIHSNEENLDDDVDDDIGDTDDDVDNDVENNGK